MEIAQLRQELNDLLENVVEHSQRYSGNCSIPSLEINHVLTKVNKMQETLIVLKHLIKAEEVQIKKEKQLKRKQQEDIAEIEVVESTSPIENIVKEEQEIKVDEPIEIVVEEEKTLTEEAPLKQPIEEPTKPITNIEQLPIAKLVDAFSLNDRYLYANELFNKDMGAFNEAVKNLDTCANFDEAQVILMNAGTTNNWDVENEYVLSFTNLVERRFL